MRREMRQKRCRFTHRLYVQPPVLHIDKHMSMSRSMGFVDKQTRLCIVEAAGQWTTHQCCSYKEDSRKIWNLSLNLTRPNLVFILLAPTGALIVIVCYYILSGHFLRFEMFYVLRAFSVSFCQSVPPEFLR